LRPWIPIIAATLAASADHSASTKKAGSKQMKRIMSLIILAGAAALVVCAAQTPATSSAPVSASSAPAADKFKIPYGFTRSDVNGEERYCRNEPVPGGSLAQRAKHCYTRAQLEATQNKNQDLSNQNIPRGVGSDQGPLLH
jgi:hypothetical protein